jgi:drug/metabolite transporter (DMT)-like permease
MMTLTWVLLAVSCYFLWRREARWGWAVVVAALIVGIIIFTRDVDFTTNLGVQL